MTSQKSCVFEIINKLNSKIVELDSASGREKLMEYIIPDGNGRTDNVFVRPFAAEGIHADTFPPTPQSAVIADKRR